MSDVRGQQGRRMVYLRCGHCGCEFLASVWMTKKARSSNPNKNNYCSDVCRFAAIPGRPRIRPLLKATCPTCNKSFESYSTKIFCSIKCYTTSPGMLERLRSNREKLMAACAAKRKGPLLVEYTCLSCGVKWVGRSNLRAKYCSKRCYRRYMMERFDRWIANPQSIALPQCFDEFLSQAELPCLVAGCGWVGENLSSHANFAHGMQADDFKRACGFNIGTGLVGAELATRLGQWLRPGTLHPNWRSNKTPPMNTRGYRSLEGDEHCAKARALMCATSEPLPPRPCRNCGVEFRPGPLGFGARYHSLKCRNEWYSKALAAEAATSAFRTCLVCGCQFRPSGCLVRKIRNHPGDKVGIVCSTKCRQKLNAQNGAITRKRAQTAGCVANASTVSEP